MMEAVQNGAARKAGHIALVQYDPEFVRMERINVGVILLFPGEAPRIRTGVSETRLHAVGVPDEKIAFIRENVARFPRRFLYENPTLDSPAELDRWGARLGNDILLTPARGITVLDSNAALDRLFVERVESASAGLKARLETLFSRADVNSHIQRDLSVAVPELRGVHAPYAYRNGVLNLVRPIELDARAEEAAGYWRLVGGLLRRSEDPTVRDARVEVVLAAPRTPAESRTLESLREILAGSEVAVYEEPALAEYEARVVAALAH